MNCRHPYPGRSSVLPGAVVICGKLARFEVRIGDRWEPRCTLHKGDGDEVRLA